MKVLILGTDHIYQTGNKSCSQYDIDNFKHTIKSIISKLSINGIYEEMNPEGLQKYSVDQTISKNICNQLYLKHMFIDPDTSERNNEGILERGLIKFRGLNNGASNNEIKKEILAQDQKRERYWLNQLKINAEGTIMFICGSDHVKRFHKLLQKNHIQSEVLFDDWVPKN